MYTKINLEKALDVIARETNLNRQAAEAYSHSDPVWAARMAAVHVGQMLFAVLVECKEREDFNAKS